MGSTKGVQLQSSEVRMLYADARGKFGGHRTTFVFCHRFGDTSQTRPIIVLKRWAATRAALWLMDVESLAKIVQAKLHLSSFSQADNCLEKRLCIAPPLVLA